MGTEKITKYSLQSHFHLMYGVVSRINGDEPFPMLGTLVSLLSQKLEMAPTLSLRVSRSERQNRQLKSRKALLERRFKDEDEELVSKGKALGAVKTSAFQPK